MYLTREQRQQYKEINARMIDKRVYCLRDGTNGFYGTVIDVEGAENFVVRRNDNREVLVSMFMVRSIDDGVDEGFKEAVNHVFKEHNELLSKLA